MDVPLDTSHASRLSQALRRAFAVHAGAGLAAPHARGLWVSQSLYPIGRLDAESEGLLLLSDERELNARLLEPGRGIGASTGRRSSGCRAAALDARARPRARRPADAALPRLAPRPAARGPAARAAHSRAQSVPDCWIALELVEGKYHQVRRMTAAIGHPTLRLLRVQVGEFRLGELPAGEWRALTPAERALVFG